MADDRATVYTEADQTIYRASAFGHCPRQLILASRGYDPVPWPKGILAAFQAGNDAEQLLINYMRRPEQTEVIKRDKNGEPSEWIIIDDPLSYWSIYGEQREYDISLLPGRVIRVHIDALGRKFNTRDDGTNQQSISLGSGDQEYVIEYKAFGPDLVAKFLANGIDDMEAYRMQVSIEMLATGNPCLFVVMDKVATVDLTDPYVYYLLITEPPYTKSDMIKRLLQLEKHQRDNSLPDCGDEVNHGFCPYYRYHDRPDTSSIPIADGVMSNLIRRFAQLGADIKLLSAEQDEIKATLREAMGVDAPQKVDDQLFGFYTSTRNNWDTKALTATLATIAPELDIEQFHTTTEVVTARFSDAT